MSRVATSALYEIDWTSFLEPQDTNDAWLLFKSKFQVIDIIDKYVPAYKPKERKNLYTTPEVFNLKRKKNKLWKKYRSTCSQHDLSNFKLVNNELRSRNLRRNYIWRTVSAECS